MIESVYHWLDNHEDEMIDFVEEYISYRSPTEEEEEVQREFIEPFFRDKMGWDDVEIVDVTDEHDRPNVNGRLEGTDDGDGRNLLFNGHSDIVDVSPEAEEGWSKDPWNSVIEDGKLYGRGSNDMKGPNTAMIWAAKAVMESDVELSGDLLMSIVVGEELDQQEFGSIAATDAHLANVDEIPICVNVEPTNNEIHTKSSATFDFTIEIQGKDIHTSQKNLTQYPQRHGIPQGQDVGVDAAEIMTQILQRFRDLEHEWNMRYQDEIYGGGGKPRSDVQGVGPIGINCTIMEAGDYIAAIPGNAKIEGHVFYPPFVEDEDLWAEMQDAVEGLATTNDWLKENPPTMRWKDVFDWPAFDVSPDHPGCQALGDSYEEVTGDTPIYSGFKAVADNGYIQRDCGVDTISMGPGDISMGAHGPDEYLPLDQFMTAAKTYATMILRWCT
ncbi:M20 family metallopeptidase [Halomicrococcus sp. NG-SE-24]|uniref:M20 family metallopeptidase n=1 Tax=Halomicrococcus sp. NG-SE-24 TaxID=3436928 RepID=UPI003D979002